MAERSGLRDSLAPVNFHGGGDEREVDESDMSDRTSSRPARPVGVEIVAAILVLSGLYFVANIQNVIWLLNCPLGVLLLISGYGAWNGRRFAYRLTETSIVLVLIGNTLFLVIVYSLAGFLPIEDAAIPVSSAVMTAAVFVYFSKRRVLEWFGRPVP